MPYRPQGDPEFRQKYQEMRERENARLNDPARKRREQQERLLNIFASIAPVAGTAIGAGAGAAIGAAKGNPLLGASIGGALGGAGGSLAGIGASEAAKYGSYEDRRKDEEAAERSRLIYDTIGRL